MNERLGVTLAPTKQIPLDAVVELALLAERLAYESIWVPETWGYDAVTLLSMLAVKTSRIRLASGVLNVFSRSAALVAQTAASLQDLSESRFVLGLGTSGPIVVESWHGVPFRDPIVRTREYVGVIRLALSGQSVDYEGETMRLRRFRLLNPPAVMPPIYVAALGTRNVRLTGEIADGWLPTFAARGQLDALRGELRAGMTLAGRRPGAIDVAAYLPAALGPSGERLLRQQLAYYIGGMGTFYHGFISRLGLGGDADEVRAHWTAGRHREAAAAVSQEILDLCTLGSSADQARRRLTEYREDGIGLPIVGIPHGASVQEVADTIEALALDRSMSGIPDR